ncbi:MAG: hypothetical protein ACKO7W_03985 [Elainella sp.]
MQPDLTDLRITASQLEKLTGLDISDAFMGRIYRPSVFRSMHRLIPFLITESFTLGLIIIFCLPVGLVVGRGLGFLTSSNTLPFMLALLTLALLMFAGWNLYMWSQTQSLKTLAHLLDEVDKHNEIIAAVDVIDELARVQGATVRLIDRSEVLQALTASRESLINALITEKILRKHQRLITRRQELFASIETNLATLQTLQINNQATEYGQLLNEALQIGLSVRRELEQRG